MKVTDIHPKAFILHLNQFYPKQKHLHNADQHQQYHNHYLICKIEYLQQKRNKVENNENPKYREIILLRDFKLIINQHLYARKGIHWKRVLHNDVLQILGYLEVGEHVGSDGFSASEFLQFLGEDNGLKVEEVMFYGDGAVDFVVEVDEVSYALVEALFQGLAV